MKITFICLSLFFVACASCSPSFETGTAVVGPNIDATRKIRAHVVNSYPWGQEELWSKIYLFFEHKGYKIKSFDKVNGFIQTDWITEKYPPDLTPADFNNKVYRCAFLIGPGNPKWNGLRYRYRVQIVGIMTNQSRVYVEAYIESFSWDGSQTWVRLLSNGALEELLFANLNSELNYAPPTK